VKGGSAAATPYARAVHALAKERNQTDVVGRELAAVTAMLEREPEVSAFFGRPWIPATAKRAAALELAAHLGLSDLTRDFLGLVARQGRANYLTAMAGVFRELVDEDLGRVRAKVRSAVALTEADRQALRQRLGRALTGKQVVLEETVDERLLGGFIAEVGSYIVDGSLDGQLARLGARLARG